MTTLISLFREAASGPSRYKTVVSDVSGEEWTLEELDVRSEQLAKYFIQNFGAKKGSSIGIFMEKSINYVLAYTAALKAGCAYVPMDTSYPVSHVKDIIVEVEPAVVCTTQNNVPRLPEGTPVYMFTDIECALNQVQLPIVEPDDAAYIVYSSGTTGKPKGIICPHRGAVFSYQYRFSKYPYSEDEREACNVFFVWELFRPLLQGVRMYIIPDEIIFDPLGLCDFLLRNRITRMLFTPSLLETLIDTMNEERIKTCFSSLRLIILCGEVVTIKLLRRISKIFSTIQIVNLYSISECHDVSYGDLTGFVESTEETNYVSTGTLIPGVKVAIFSCQLERVSTSSHGEIYVSGPTLAIGYLNRPELNQTRFLAVSEEFSSELGSRMYRTGDWGYLLPNNVLKIAGRCDTLVKIRGYSVEMKAIEANLNELSYVKNCAVTIIGAEGEDKKLAAYIVLSETLTKKKIRADLKQRLPFYMIPSYFSFMESLPLLPSSSKVDKKTLPPINPETDVTEVDSLPQTPTEIILAKLWSEVLLRSEIDVQESFFDLGGHSLMASRLLGKIEREFGIVFTMNDLFSTPTVAAMARSIDMKGLNERKASKNLLKEVDIHDLNIPINGIQLRTFWRSLHWKNRYCSSLILITGVTGYVGSHILVDILNNTQVRVICMIRETDLHSNQKRLETSLKNIGVLNDSLRQKVADRVKIVSGDIVLHRLGLCEEDYAFLSQDVDAVIHVAAYVNLIYPYEALYGINVLGTRNILELCQKNKLKILHYISTDAVIPRNLKFADESTDVSNAQERLESGYGESKWVAEQIVQKACSRGLPVVIYRLGNQAPGQLIGKWNKLDFIFMMLISSIRINTAPKIDWTIEMTPVDFSALFIRRILTERYEAGIGTIFHITNSGATTWIQLVQWMKDFGMLIKLVEYDEWIRLVAENESIECQQLGKIINGMARDKAFFTGHTLYGRSNTDKELKQTNCKYPLITESLFRRWFNALIDRELTESGNNLMSKVCIITGASEGIGAAIARKLAVDGGQRIVLAARKTRVLADLARKLEQDGCPHGNIMICVCDITSMKDVQNMMGCTMRKFGRIDVLVNCAGCMYYQHMKNGAKEEWDRQIDVNCRGTTYCIGAVLPCMIDAGAGHIINITSDAGKIGFPGLAVYSGSKFYIEGLSQALRKELCDDGIKITNIQPGDVRTDLASRSTDIEARAKFDASTKGYQILDVDDVARTVWFVIKQPSHVAINEMLIEPQGAPI